jgi:hypothetical protein
LPNFYKTEIKPLRATDKAAEHNQETLNGRVNDYFYSKKLIKTELMSMRDAIVAKFYFYWFFIIFELIFALGNCYGASGFYEE